MPSPTITVTHEHRIATLSFNRPEVLNAFDPVLVDETVAAIRRFGTDDETLAIIVRGEGRAFSAGFDLKASAQAGRRSLQEWRPRT